MWWLSLLFNSEIRVWLTIFFLYSVFYILPIIYSLFFLFSLFSGQYSLYFPFCIFILYSLSLIPHSSFLVVICTRDHPKILLALCLAFWIPSHLHISIFWLLKLCDEKRLILQSLQVFLATEKKYTYLLENPVFITGFFCLLHVLSCSALQLAISSATTFLEKCSKVDLEKWFCKLDFFFLVNRFSQTRKKKWICRTTYLQPEKRWISSINPPFFWSTIFLEPEKNRSLQNHFSPTRFFEPNFSNQISRTRFLKTAKSEDID